MTIPDERTYNYDDIKPGYYDEIFHKNQGIQSKWHKLKFQFLKEKTGSFQSHLDVGCGAGTFIGMLDAGQGHSIGVDIAVQQVSYAAEKYGAQNCEFRAVGLHDPLPFDGDTFDVVTLIELIEHLREEDIKVLLKDLYRIMKPGARLILTTPNYLSMWPLIEVFLNKLSTVSYEKQHITHFTRKKLKNLLKETGFREVCVKPFHGYASFFALFSWKLADSVDGFERSFLNNIYGLLLLAEVVK